MTDEDFVENDRQYSPDKSMVILKYCRDTGAFGFGQGATAVLKTSDLGKELTQFNLPRDKNLSRLEWIDNHTISSQIDIIPFIRNNEAIEFEDIEINGIKVKVSAFDHIENDYHLEIEHREASPDGQLELVAYRYLDDPQRNLNFIHISIIKKGESIPRYGNYFIGDMQSDRIWNGTWKKDNTLLFYSNSKDAGYAQYDFVRNKPDIKYEIISDDKKYDNKYRWKD